MKKIKKLYLLSVIMILLVPTWVFAAPLQLVQKPVLVAHGMGSIDNTPITNSLEAFMLNYTKGYRVFEVDLNMTLDKQVVCYHDAWNFVNHTGGYYPAALEKFKTQTLLGKYSTVTLDKLIRLMSLYDDVYIITDVKDYTKDEFKDYFKQVVEKAYQIDPSVLERFIIQVYSPETLEWAREVYNFENIIFTTYASKLTDKQIVKFAKDKKIDIVTTPVDRISQKFVNDLHSNGIQVYTHTVNELSELQKLKHFNIDGYYTDVLTYSDINKLR